MLQESLIASILLLIAGFAAVGMKHLAGSIAPLRETTARWCLPTHFAFVVSLFVGLAHILSRLGAPVLLPFGLAYAAFALLGVARGLGHVREGRASRWLRPRPARAAVLLVFIVSLVAWSGVLGPLALFPSIHDGMAHATFFSYMKTHDTLFLETLASPFGDVFGASRVGPYPLGAHFLFALFAWPLTSLGLVGDALALKAVLLAVLASAPLVVSWVAVRFLPVRRPWLWPVLAILVSTTYAFPFQPLDSGGVNRLVGMAWTAAIPLGFARARQIRFWHAPLIALVFLGLFFIHPSLFNIQCFLCGVLVLVPALRALPNLRTAARRLFPFVVGMGITGAALVPLLDVQSNRTIQIEKSVDGLPVPAPWDGKVVSRRINGLKRSLLLERKVPGMPPFRSVALGVGIAFLFAAPFLRTTRQRKAAWTQCAAVFVCTVGFSILMVASQFIPFSPLNMLGFTVYFATDRIGDITGVPVTMALGVGVWALFVALPRRFLGGVHETVAARIRVAVGVAGVLFLARQTDKGWRESVEVLEGSFRHYDTPLRVNYEPLTSWLREEVPRDTLVVASSLDADLIPAFSGHDTLFRYGECMNPEPEPPCWARRKFSDDFLFGIRVVLSKAPRPRPAASLSTSFTPSALPECARDLERFRRPTLIVSKGLSLWARGLPDGTRVCRDLTLVGRKGPYLVLAAHSSASPSSP